MATQLKNAKILHKGDKLLLIDAPEEIKWMKIHSESVRQWHGCPMKIPMQLLSEEMAIRNHDQTLEKLNSRGGLGISEIACNIRETRLNFKNETIEDLHFVMERINRFNIEQEEALSKAPTWEIKNAKDVIDTMATEEALGKGLSYEKFMDWQPEQGKLYDLPKNYGYKFIEDDHPITKAFRRVDEMHGNKIQYPQLAILIPQQEVKGESQEDLWGDLCIDIKIYTTKEQDNFVRDNYTIKRKTL